MSLFNRKPKCEHQWEVKGWGHTRHSIEGWNGQELSWWYNTNITEQCTKCGEINCRVQRGRFEDPRGKK